MGKWVFMLIATYAQVIDLKIDIIYGVTELRIYGFFEINRAQYVIL